MLFKKRREILGVSNGKLSPCPELPNCICSQTASTDYHFITPLTFPFDPAQGMAKLAILVSSLPGVKTINCKNNYILAECRTPIVGIVSDLELFWHPSDRVCHVRSAARHGISDFGLNRKRVEKIRKLILSDFIQAKRAENELQGVD